MFSLYGGVKIVHGPQRKEYELLETSGAMMDYVGGSSLHIPSSSFKSLSDLSTSKSSSSSIEGELVDGTLSLEEEVSGSS